MLEVELEIIELELEMATRLGNEAGRGGVLPSLSLNQGQNSDYTICIFRNFCPFLRCNENSTNLFKREFQRVIT